MNKERGEAKATLFVGQAAEVSKDQWRRPLRSAGCGSKATRGNPTLVNGQPVGTAQSLHLLASDVSTSTMSSVGSLSGSVLGRMERSQSATRDSRRCGMEALALGLNTAGRYPYAPPHVQDFDLAVVGRAQ